MIVIVCQSFQCGVQLTFCWISQNKPAVSQCIAVPLANLWCIKMIHHVQLLAFFYLNVAQVEIDTCAFSTKGKVLMAVKGYGNRRLGLLSP